MAKIYGITGGIATGKSYVAQIIKEAGYTVYSADEIAHAVGENTQVIKQIANRFGTGVIIRNKLNRSKLGEIVFTDEKKLAALNEIMAPEIRKKIMAIIDKVHQQSEKPVFMEIPLLFEQGYENEFDGSILVDAEFEVQLQRLMNRDQIMEDFAKKKIESQMPLSEKKDKATYIIDNSQDDEVEELVKTLLRKLNINL
ncbi:dephospho-CoA kinase [Companilactobacillus sp. RD055328]|uniref:dephospho-CoA kinase n=1 Tax=Companilactobacillus sp. RD055328 TaxID=2916634 RepID=UPI001FC88471|nr:dephospho-CoA kinase [Companilactobacillus sp. RD055328]GKQ42502.1 dephospho-CoA kinase [Companilactobacillus sp. RD055328]